MTFVKILFAICYLFALSFIVPVKADTFKKASYYGMDFFGKKTASGEMFNPYAMTAAHKTLPFGTKVKVTNKLNDETVIVRINDRGPFVKGRVIDVSLAAAEELDMMEDGVVPVKIEVLT